MRKLVKLMTISTIAATTALQVTACKDDSQYNTFMSDVSNSVTNNTAFFGFLGSIDDEVSNNLQTSFDVFNTIRKDGTSQWQKWINDNMEMLNHPDLKLTNISLRYYQGPKHENSTSDAADSLWNDKNISWQKNIFNWIHSRTNGNQFKENPKGVPGVTKLETKKDASGEDMFEKLPVVFIISKGKLITAGQNWISSSDPYQQFEAITEFVLANLLLVS